MTTIRTQLRPGDLGRIVALHGDVYAAERGWDATFEAYVAAGLAGFVLQHDPQRERVWVVDLDGSVRGSIAIVRAADGVAQLRWFLLAPEVRGLGLGRELIRAALAFCRDAGYRRVLLWTEASLQAAAGLYEQAGFRLTEEKTHEQWGAVVTERRYDLELP